MVTKKDKYLAAAQKFLDRGQLDKALAEFARVVQEDPKDTRTWLKMAELHAKRGAAEQATEIYLKTGEQYTEQGFFQKAVAVYKNVLKLSPGYVAGHFKLADVYKRLGLMSDAAGQLELAAASLQKTGKGPEALAALRQIVELGPDNVGSRIRLAESASQAGLTDEAIAEFGRAADQLKAQGRVDEYIRVAERLLFHQPNNLAVARSLAEAYIGKKNARLALAKLQVCLKAQPRDPETVSLLARAFEQLDVPKAVSVWRELAEIYAAVGRAGDRDQALGKALALAPRDEEALELQRRWGGGGGGISVGWGTVPGLLPLRPPPISEGTGSGRPPPLPIDSFGVKRSGGTGASGSVMPAAPAAPGVNQDIARIMAESEVFVKYGLLDRAVDHLRRIFEIQPDHQPARDKLAAVLSQLGRSPEPEALRILDRSPPERTLEPPREPTLEPPSGLTLEPPLARTLEPPPEPSPEPLPIEVSPDLERTDQAGPVAGSDGVVEVDSGDVTRSADDELEIEIEPLDLDTGGLEVVSFDENPATTIGTFDDHPATTLGSLEDTGWGSSPATTLGSLDDEFLAPPPTAPSATVVAAVDGELLSEMEQIEFFIEQSMIEEAWQGLEDARERFGSHPLIEQKLQQVRRLQENEPGAIPRAPAADQSGSAADENHSQPVAVMADGGAADLSTHGDLGIAYKEMGLYDAAIAEFKQLVRDPRRQVFALTMIGECFETKGAYKDAVIHYKEALNNPGASETETTLLYYLLGNTFQLLNDRNEALYFFEKVARRDAKFRDVEARVAALKPLNVRRA